MEINEEFSKGPFFNKAGNSYLPFLIDRIPKGIPMEATASKSEHKLFKVFSDEKLHFENSKVFR